LLLGLVVVFVIVPWLLVNHTSWAGPLFANTLRRVIGSERVTHLEEFSYGIADRINRWKHRNEAPQARWSVASGMHPVTAIGLPLLTLGARTTRH
jgi:hypothetical protein